MMPPGSDPPRFEIAFCPLSERDISNYYHGMCNRGLWPLMHFMTANCHFNTLHWRYYEAVNRNFAALAAAEACDDDVVWVQDFHLALVPRLLREQRPRLPIGLFWHVPFPPEQIFRVFPWRSELLEGMLGADLVGFHTDSYVTQFLNCCERILGLRVDRKRNEVATPRGPVRAGVFPLGIPADYFAGLAASPRVRDRTQRIRRALRVERVVLGVDRLDYTKGILERLLGFERFLETNPAYHRRVTLVLIAVPSRTKVADYAALKRELDELVGRIIGHFSSEGWVPIRYLYTQFGAEDLVAYYQAADVALLTPLRDGMNLVAKEYIAAHLADDGALILSEFAGAAEELTQALLVNPYDVDAIAASLKQALEMRSGRARGQDACDAHPGASQQPRALVGPLPERAGAGAELCRRGPRQRLSRRRSCRPRCSSSSPLAARFCSVWTTTALSPNWSNGPRWRVRSKAWWRRSRRSRHCASASPSRSSAAARSRNCAG